MSLQKKYAKHLLALVACSLMLIVFTSYVRAQEGERATDSSKSGTTVVMVMTGPLSDVPGQEPLTIVSKTPRDVVKSLNAVNEFDVLPGKTYSVTVWVRDSQGNNIPNSKVTINLVPGTNNGGHLHAPSTRPVGTFEPSSFDLPTGERSNIKFMTPLVSGQVLVNGSCTSGNGSTCTWNPWIYNVRVPDLFELPSGFLYNLIGSLPGEHVANHWGTPAFNRALVDVAWLYYADEGNTTGDKLNFNDMSLPWGGVFDLDLNWVPPHKGHRLGINIDLGSRTVPVKRRSNLVHLLETQGFGVWDEVKKRNHWHLTYKGKGSGSSPQDGGVVDTVIPNTEGQSASAALNVTTTVVVSQDPTTGLYTYNYSFNNSLGSGLEVNSLMIRLNGSIAFEPKAPQGWTAAIHRDGSAVSFAATEIGEVPPDFIDDGRLLPSPFQIRPGQTLSGFSFRSFDPPTGTVFTADGFEPLPPAVEDDAALPPRDFSGNTEGPSRAVSGQLIDDAQFFVRQHYLDFLSREPDAGGFKAWVNVLKGCPTQFNTNPNSPSASCDRNIVSSSFFRSQEFEIKGRFVFNFYRLSFNRLPLYTEFIPDMGSVAGATPQEVFVKKATFTNNWVTRPEFQTSYGSASNQGFVTTLMNRYGLTSIRTPNPATPDAAQRITLTRDDLIARLNASTLTRAQVLRAIADSDEVSNAEFRQAFVAMQYYGYLRRTPETAGYQAWLNYLNANPTDFRTMVNGFMNSVEYRLRFGQP